MKQLFAIFLLAVLAVTAHAADLGTIQLDKELGYNIGRYGSFQSTTEKGACVAARIKWIGGDDYTTAPSVTVASGGDVTLKVDGAVDPDFGWTTELTELGVLDLSSPDATIDTYGELKALFDAHSTNWQLVLVDALPSDKTDNTLYTRSETSTGLLDQEGLPLYLDSGVAMNAAGDYIYSLSIGPEELPKELLSVTNLASRTMDPPGSQIYTAELYDIDAVGTFSSGASYVEVWAVKDSTEVKLWHSVGAASTVAFSKYFVANGGRPLRAPAGYKLVVRYCSDTAAFTAGSLSINGLIY